MTKFLYFLIIPFLFSCTVSNKLAETFKKEETYALEYALAETEIRLEFTLIQEQFIPGPFAAYAEKYLSIDGVKKNEFTRWHIAGIGAHSIHSPDETEIYRLEGVTEDFYEKYIEFSKHGFLISPFEVNTDSGNVRSVPKRNELTFTDYSVKRNFPKRTNQESFSSHGRLINKKSIEEKAEEAANFIIKTRKRRFKLIAGQYEVTPSGDALAFSVSELNDIEKEYLSLFIGKTNVDTLKLVTYFKPEQLSTEEYSNIAYFSDSLGLHTEWKNGALPVELRLKNLHEAKPMEATASDSTMHQLFYRYPAEAELSLKLNNEIIYLQRIKVFQYAPLRSLKLEK
jgi:hypothetical protein